MTIREMQDRYYELRTKFAAGVISREIFEAQVAQLQYQDAQGRYWAIGLQTGEWYVHEGGHWRPEKKTQPPAKPTCVYCHQLLPPGSTTCELCGKRVAPPPPPPLEPAPGARGLAPLKPERQRSWLLLGGAVTVALVLLVGGFCLISGALVYTNTTLSMAGLPGWPMLGVGNTPAATPVTTATPTTAPPTPVPATPTTQIAAFPTAIATRAATPNPPGTLAPQALYESGSLGFQLRYPTGWAYEEQQRGVIFAAHEDDLDVQGLVDGRTFGVIAGADMLKGSTPQDVLKSLIDSLEGEDILIGTVQTDTLDTEAGASVLVSLVPTGEDMTLKMYLLVAFHADQGYMVMATAPVERWKATWPTYQAMLQSFRFAEPPPTPVLWTPTRTLPPPTATPRTTRPQPTATPVLGPGFTYRQDGPIEPGPGDCKSTAMVWGYVHNADGQVMDGVYLFVTFEGGAWGPAPQVARTDEKGVYRLQLPTGQKGTYRVTVIKGWQDRTPLSPPSDPIEVSNYCEHSGFKVNWRQIAPRTPTPTPPPTPLPVVSDYPFEKDGNITLSEPNCGQPFKVRGRISGLNEWAGRITVKVRDPDGVVNDFAEAVRSDGTYLLPTVQARGGEYLIWLEEKGSGERLSDHVVFSGVDPCVATIFEINWKRRK